MTLEEILQSWRQAWPGALELWSRYLRMSEPRWCLTPQDEEREGIRDGFAMIRLTDQAVVISVREVAALGLDGFAREVLAHEVGHHVYTPADLTDHARMLARMRSGLPGVEEAAPLVANLYQDLLINDRLLRTHKLSQAPVFAHLRRVQRSSAPADHAAVPPLWDLYMRIYEILWSLRRGTLAGPLDEVGEGDARLGARLIRSYAHDWLRGSGTFAALCLRYLLADAEQSGIRGLRLLDALSTGVGADVPMGLIELEGDELTVRHPSEDPLLSGLEATVQEASEEPGEAASAQAWGQHREPFELGQILKALGLELSPHQVAMRYYRERALPHLVPFPRRRMPEDPEPLLEGLEVWDFGSPIEDVDWLESALVSPEVVPGVTTRRRVYGTSSGLEPRVEPVDLDLYVDCSGSMPDPRVNVSYLALAGTIVALSALRAGSRVQATLWSGARQFQTTPGFVRDETAILRILTGYLGGGTAFPLHLLRDTFQNRDERDRAVHILVISDDGVDTMLQRDERGTAGSEIARMALEKARGGGTMVLNLWQDCERYPFAATFREQGWQVSRVTNWEELIRFARDFSRKNYLRETVSAPGWSGGR